MSQTLARVNCPSCGQPFGTPVEQIIDVEVDPSAKSRVLTGQVNVAVCPHCGAMGGLSVPFLYHDPARELALVMMPMEAGRTEVERQKVIGALSRAVMSQMPPEQRKGYLLNPQVFFSLDSVVKKVLEAEGITEEMIEAQRAKLELLQMLMATPVEERPALVQENAALLDAEFFQIMHANMAQVESIGRQDVLRGLLDLRAMLFEETEMGRRLAVQARAVQTLRENPTREKLLSLLVEVEDRETREVLVTLGQSLMDYFFFQSLTRRIEEQKDATERQRLEALRKEVIDIREDLRVQMQQVFAEKESLIHDLLVSENRELLARRRMADMDELFFSVLVAERERAQEAGDVEAAAELEAVWKLVMGLVEASVPPEVRFLEEIMGAEDEAALRAIFEQNQQFVNPALLDLLTQVEAQLQEQGENEAALRASRARSVASTMVQAAAAKPAPAPQPGPPPAPPEDQAAGEKRRPSGLLIAK
ncbi:MAG: hypothetical protein JXD18_11055 [Anaerolineae bacterium]|nr:hypothetical protein [Anaerolineae bacterium]